MDSEDLGDEVEPLEEMLAASETVSELRREIQAQKENNAHLRGQIESLVMLFEYRVDTIYARIGELLDGGGDPRIEVHREREAPLSAAGSGALPPDPADGLWRVDDDLFEFLKTDLRCLADVSGKFLRTKRPTVFSQPLTALGFKYKVDHARQADDHIALLASDRPRVGVYGPYFTGEAGTYELLFKASGGASAHVDVLCNFHKRILTVYRGQNQQDTVVLHRFSFTITDEEQGYPIEFRIFTAEEPYKISIS